MKLLVWTKRKGSGHDIRACTGDIKTFMPFCPARGFNKTNLFLQERIKSSLNAHLGKQVGFVEFVSWPIKKFFKDISSPLAAPALLRIVALREHFLSRKTVICGNSNYSMKNLKIFIPKATWQAANKSTDVLGSVFLLWGLSQSRKPCIWERTGSHINSSYTSGLSLEISHFLAGGHG